eukprot:CAMPEP_0116154864 /NCGR_PEP_ID=MMETSP0329-20121206/22006_1 /TAXON_ID=697910 /ORGANISM="Pseudo-nitzschia arenysensis, Strain B593" /LENGTH=562 /DNA_ID=CAMNT_0003651869 /DNA_START=200 /DNA_END=1885 /DNA_ORIENTATION=+
MDQLDDLMSGTSPRISLEPDTNMLAFTISNYVYVRDMIHDMFQMMDDVVGFSSKHFFLVAIDQQSAELACKYGYPVVMWKANEINIQNAVANSKLIFSHELVKRGIDFFFTEMDVWWIRSPKPKLIDFQKRHVGDQNSMDHVGKHYYVSGHQNNPDKPNIGVFAAKADVYSEEYFRVCLDIISQQPNTHDQFIMNHVHELFSDNYHGREFNHRVSRYEGEVKFPKVQYPFQGLMFSPHEIVADERPTTTQLTLAIHTLCSKPLQFPVGKQMNAKELGVYYGFHSHPPEISEANAVAAGYYDRSGNYRRYLWLNTEVRNNFYSHVNPKNLKHMLTMEWTLAILMAIARKTNRILVLPQIFNAHHDAGTYFTWSIMDFSNVTEIVDLRETNFLTNPKAWRRRNKSADYWPFESVVDTGLFQSVDGDKNKTMIYTQFSDRSSIVSNTVWNSTVPEHEWLDAWVGSLSASPEFDSAEVLLVNPDLFIDRSTSEASFKRLRAWQQQEKGPIHTKLQPIGRMEKEVLKIHDMLGWCWGRDKGFRQTGNKIRATDSCFGLGKPRDSKIN